MRPPVDFFQFVVVREEVNNREEFEINDEWKIHCYLAAIPRIALAQLNY